MNPSRQLAAAAPSVQGSAVLLLVALLSGCSRSSDSTSAGTSMVRLNEIMARNQNVPVTVGTKVSFADWVEIHNESTSTVSLAGYTLSDRRDTPDKFEFPPGTMLAPGGFLVVFLLDPSNCASDCDVDAAECLQEAEDPAEEAACEVDRAACREQCFPPGLVSGFNMSDEGETLFLFAERGTVLVDQKGVKNQPADVSNGLDPETGEYGVIYLPTPGEKNESVNLKTQRFSAPPRPQVTKNPALPIRVPFVIDRDLAAPGTLVVTLEHAAVASCGDALQGDGVTRVALSPGSETEVMEMRPDPSGNPVEVPVTRSEFVALLPAPGTCGVHRKYRIVARDSLREIDWPDCITACVPPPTVIVNEYQPNNTAFQFIRTNSSGDVDEPSTPDWIEIFNFGDEPVDIRGLGLVGRGSLEEKRFASWTFGREGGVTDPLPAKSFLLVLADDHPRSTYRWKEDVDSKDPDPRIHHSTRFQLDAFANQVPPPPGTKAPPAPTGDPPDTFALVRAAHPADPLSIGGEVLDVVVLDFSKVSYVPGQSAGRFPDVEGTEPDALDPGTVSSCPTPEEGNHLTCDVPPAFLDEIALETPAGATRCPRAGEPVTVHASVGFDEDTPAAQIAVEVLFRLEETGPELPAGDVIVERAPDEEQNRAPIATALYRVRAVIPPQPDGTLVVYRLRATDSRLALTTIFGEESADMGRRPTAAFRYLVGFTRPPASPRLNEVLPGNTATPLPYWDFVPEAERSFLEYLELQNPGDAPFDLAGFYLTNDLAKARLFEFPSDGSAVVPPRGFLIAYFGPRPPSIPSDPSDPNFVPFISVTGLSPDPCLGRIHLIAPEAKEAGANCEVDSLDWDLTDSDTPCPAANEDRVAARVCDGGDRVLVLGRPSPEATNVLAPIFHDAFHKVFPSLVRNTCVPEGSDVQLNAVVFVDAGVREAFRGNPSLLSGAFFVDLGAGEVTFDELDVLALPACRPGLEECAMPPPSMAALAVKPRLPIRGPFPPVVRYRISLTDGCGGAVEAGPFSFGTEAGAHPDVAINEINRSSLVPGLDAARPWIEIFNGSAAEVDLAGMFITDDPVNPRQAEFPAGARVPPGGVLVVLTSGSDTTPYPKIDFSWQAEQGTLYLMDSLERGSCIVDTLAFDFRGLPANASIGRDPDGSGSPARLDPPSPGRLNGDEVFLRADATNDLRVNITDVIKELSILFSGDPNRPPCEDALDANDDGLVDAADPVFIANSLFRHGDVIPPPFPEPGFDPTPDSLSPCGVGS